MKYNRGVGFTFDFESNKIKFGSKSKGKLSPWSYSIQFERKWKYLLSLKQNGLWWQISFRFWTKLNCFSCLDRIYIYIWILYIYVNIHIYINIFCPNWKHNRRAAFQEAGVSRQSCDASQLRTPPETPRTITALYRIVSFNKGASIWPPFCRDSSASRTADVRFSMSGLNADTHREIFPESY